MLTFSTIIHRHPLSLPLLARFKTTKSNAAWLARQNQDQFVKQRAGSFRSRSAFKLLELDDRHRFLRRGQVIVDLGAAPGGWTEAAMSRLSKISHPKEPVDSYDSDDTSPKPRRSHGSGKVVAVDLLPIAPIPGVDIIQGDFLSPIIQNKLAVLLKTDTTSRGTVDVVLSDMCRNMSGNRIRDIESSLELCGAALEFSKSYLRHEDDSTSTGGNRAGVLVMKHFSHPLLDAFRKEQLEPRFYKVHYSKPRSSRGESSEGYWVCTGWRG